MDEVNRNEEVVEELQPIAAKKNVYTLPTDRLIPAQKRFLRAFSRIGIIRRASRVAKVSLGMHYQWMRKSPCYARAYRIAQEAATDLLEEEARRRALYGVREPVIFMGQMQFTHVDAEGKYCLPTEPGATPVPLTVTKYSDKLMALLLTGHRKRIFQDKTTTHRGQVDHRHAHVHAQVQEKRQEILASLDDLPVDLLEQICTHLDAKKALALSPPTEQPADGQQNEVATPEG